jgi:hypothetical protein
MKQAIIASDRLPVVLAREGNHEGGQLPKLPAVGSEPASQNPPAATPWLTSVTSRPEGCKSAGARSG